MKRRKWRGKAAGLFFCDQSKRQPETPALIGRIEILAAQCHLRLNRQEEGWWLMDGGESINVHAVPEAWMVLDLLEKYADLHDL
jgi:hypothetical protein